MSWKHTHKHVQHYIYVSASIPSIPVCRSCPLPITMKELNDRMDSGNPELWPYDRSSYSNGVNLWAQSEWESTFLYEDCQTDGRLWLSETFWLCLSQSPSVSLWLLPFLLVMGLRYWTTSSVNWFPLPLRRFSGISISVSLFFSVTATEAKSLKSNRGIEIWTLKPHCSITASTGGQ